MTRPEILKQKYDLEKHPEGGWYAEVYTSSASGIPEGRASMGSIYFMLEGDDISHFHQIDCEEIWYYHEGCPIKVTVLMDGKTDVTIIGTEEGQTAMAVIPKGAIFAAELLDRDSYCLLSCATTPKFSYDGFRLVDSTEIRSLFPKEYECLKHLIQEKEPSPCHIINEA